MSNNVLIGSVGTTEIIVILLLILILFGSKRIPEIAQSLGKGIREFKRSMREIENEVEAPPKHNSNQPPKEISDKKDGNLNG
ncbi:MAG: twin-arginine translocase TatA/TatE family subunit [candidate division Zixibacteria bacterium]|jgi:sec-independent protein translocase protein TatA|nr:twin-arginine translocase TatA/TatE family subunit [candidate division Zixibacteria bacterium]